MIEVKLAYPVSGDLRRLHLSSGRGYDQTQPAKGAALGPDYRLP